MSRARRRGVLLALLALPAMWSLVASDRAEAASSVVEVGWWTRSPLASAPDGGFTVGAAPDGPTSVAAMRVDLGEGLDTLVVSAQPAGEVAALASLQVCGTGDAWTAEAGGALDAAPATECAGDAVPFAPAGDSWRADVSSLVSGQDGVVTLALVPTSSSGTVPYDASFEAPTTIGAGGSPAAPTTSEPAPPAAPAPSSAPSPAASAAAPSLSPAPPATLAARPSAPSTTTAPPASESPAPPTTVPDEAGSAFELAGSGLLGADRARGARWGEALVLVLIGALVGAGVYATSRIAAARS